MIIPPTQKQINEMKEGNTELIITFLPYLLHLAQEELNYQPIHDEKIKRWENFCEKLKSRHIMTTDGSGI